MKRLIITPFIIFALVLIVWSSIDYQSANRAMSELIRSDTLVRLEVLRGNIDKHRQGAVLLARHPSTINLALYGAQENSRRDLRRLVSMTDIDGATIFDLDGTKVVSFPSRSELFLPDLIQNTENWRRAKSGSLGKLWTQNRYYFLAPVFQDGDVIAVAMSHFSLDEAYSQLLLSEFSVRILNQSQEVMYDVGSGDWAENSTTIPMNELQAVVKVLSEGQAPVFHWIGRSSIAAFVMFVLSSLIMLLLARRQRMAREIARRMEQNQILEERMEARNQELLQAQDALVKSGKLALLGQITASIAHEINQPLGAIQNYAENSTRFIELGQVDMALKNQKKIAGQAMRSSRILENLRAFSRADQVGIKPVNVQNIIVSVLEALDLRFPGSQEFIEVNGDPSVSALAGQIRLEQILMNLLVNAWHEISQLGAPRIKIEFEVKPDNTVLIQVSDNGAGIDMKAGEDVFEPFVSSRKYADGLGLGLTIARQFVDSMGGKIGLAQSPTLGGACFSIQLKANAPINRRKLNV